jgi:muconolactone delta-isomerase
VILSVKEKDMSDLVPPMMPDDLDALIQAMERVQQLEAEVARLRLTFEERQAMMRAMYRVVGADSEILWSLLERTR